MIDTGPSTRYSCVIRLPVAASLPVLAIVSSPSLCNSFKAYASSSAPSLPHARQFFFFRFPPPIVKKPVPLHRRFFMPLSPRHNPPPRPHQQLFPRRPQPLNPPRQRRIEFSRHRR